LYRRHLRIAFGSAAEAECLLKTAEEMSYLPSETVKEVEALLDGTMRTLRGLMRRPIVVHNSP
jgi:four helix bundle protein